MPGRSIWSSNELISAWSRFVIGILLRHPDVMPELRAAAGSIWDLGAAYQGSNIEGGQDVAEL
jgi:hypothetical protein